MKGDFSRFDFDSKTNTRGMLHQQGRVLLDEDWNDQTRLAVRWQDEAGRAAMGPCIAAVAEAHKDSLKILSASPSAGGIDVTFHPGQAWIDGQLAFWRQDLGATRPLVRTAAYLEGAPADPGATGTRDAVVLELHRESVSGYQVPLEMIEPALGGVDTTERMWTSLRLRMLRLASNESCADASGRLKQLGDLTRRGTLTATLQPTEQTDGDCPVTEGGGYVGLEHHLIRIEIAEVESGLAPRFKWSRFNGGLVARARFNASEGTASLTHNTQAVTRSGSDRFYMEVVEPVPSGSAGGSPAPDEASSRAERWQVVYGATVSLSGDELELPDPGDELFGSIPADDSGRTYFIRLWDGIETIQSFPQQPEPRELYEGIRLEFHRDGDYVSGDYWTFTVRAGGISTEETLLSAAPPEGLDRVYVPLAIVNWASGDATTREITDCRLVFPPLTDLRGCCLWLRAGGSIPDAIDRLRRQGGGCLCLAPGDFTLNEPISLTGAQNIHISGCGLATRVHIVSNMQSSGVFMLSRCHDVSFRSISFFNDSRVPLWAVSDTDQLHIAGTVVVTHLINSASAVVSGFGRANSRWQIEDNLFLSPVAISAQRLEHTRISNNLFFGTLRGIRLVQSVGSQVERNSFSEMPPRIGGIVGGISFPTASKEDIKTHRQASLFALIKAFLAASRTPRSGNVYEAFVANTAFDLEFCHNTVFGRVGVYTELTENCSISDNLFSVRLFGASLGLTRGLRFSRNRLGSGRNSSLSFAPQVGLRFLMDSIDCHVENNTFDGCDEGIVFESDASGSAEVVRDFTVAALDDTGKASVANDQSMLEFAEASVRSRRADFSMIAHSFFSLGRCERTRIVDNVIDAKSVGVQWSGSKQIVDFRVEGNAFKSCDDAAILIEPEDRVHYLAEPVDTKVRLITNNRFDITGAAVRASIGAVRFENNDVRVRAKPRVIAWPGLINLLGKTLITDSKFVAAAADTDVPKIRLMQPTLAASSVKTIDASSSKKFVVAAEKTIGSFTSEILDESSGAKLYATYRIANTGKVNYLSEHIWTLFAPAMVNLDGFAISLAGIQNRVVGNRLYSDSEQIDGGVALHQLSGEVLQNEIQVRRKAAFLNAKAGTQYLSARIEGNSLRVTGASSMGGTQDTTYALSIPSLGTGNLSILDNSFVGSIQVGAEPFANLGLADSNAVFVPGFLLVNHAVAWDLLDTAEYAHSTAHASTASAEPTHVSGAILAGLGVPTLTAFFFDPNRQRQVIQFSNNRVVRGYVAIAPSTGGTFWSTDELSSSSGQAPVVVMSGNVLDFWARVAGSDVVISNNQSGSGIRYRVGSRVQHSANIPQASSF